MTIYHNHIAVIGRADGDDEDSCELYEHTTIDRAKEQFADDMRNRFSDFLLEDALPPDHPIYIDLVLTSSAPITVEEQNT